MNPQEDVITGYQLEYNIEFTQEEKTEFETLKKCIAMLTNSGLLGTFDVIELSTKLVKKYKEIAENRAEENNK